MEEKISITFKAGTGYEVPWIVLKSASIEEMADDLTKVAALFADAAFLGKAFIEAFKGAPSTPGELVEQRLGGTVVNIAPPSDTPPGLGDIFKDAPPAQAPAPWDQPTTAAPMPWDVAPAGVPAARPPVLIELPFTKEGDANYERVRQFKNYFFQQRNKLEWNKGRKGFEFTSAPTPEQLDMARKGAAALGGKVVE